MIVRRFWNIGISQLLPQLTAAIICLAVTAKGEVSVAKIEPVLRPSAIQTVQPFVGELKFLGTPTLAKPCSVSVNLTSLKALETEEYFRIEMFGTYGFQVAPDSVAWKLPIDSASSREFIFTFIPRLVGTFQIGFSHWKKNRWEQLASLAFAIDEDGKTLYSGTATGNRLSIITPHPIRSASPLAIAFPLRGDRFNSAVDPHFTGEFTFSKAPAKGETTFVDFRLTSHTDLYSKVQFVLDYSTNLKVSDLPASWGDSSRATSKPLKYSGQFWFIPSTLGIGALNFRIVGKTDGKQFNRSTTEFPIFYVLGEDGKLLFLGSYEPWTRFKSKTDAMLGSLAALIDVADRDYRFKQVLSKPDYQGDENMLPEDTTAGGHK